MSPHTGQQDVDDDRICKGRVRVSVRCADIGEGHVTAARSLAADLAARDDVEAVELRADLNVLGRHLGALGRLSVPVCSSISDPAGLYYWAHPGIDLHLLSWPESLAEVDQIAGPGRASAVRPVIDRRFLAAPPRDLARASLSLPEPTPVLLISGGGWGIGDLAGATEVALTAGSESIVICLAGCNSRLHEELVATHQSE